MKKINLRMIELTFKIVLSCCFIFLIHSTILAQSPQAIPYQAVARNTGGSLIINQAISLRFTIHQLTSNGVIVFQETQTANTNSLGLFNVNIGSGTTLSGTFNSIDWSNGSKFLQVEFDPSGGTSYIDMGTTQLLSVPYALYAEKANVPGLPGPAGPAGSANISGSVNSLVKFTGANTGGNSIITDNGTNVGIGNTLPAAKLDIAGQVKISGGAPGNGKILTSDINGLASWQNLPAPGTLIGYVRLQDPYGNNLFSNLSGTTVSVDGTSFVTTTNADGRFQFAALPAGTYGITATKAGYGTDNIDRITYVGGSTQTYIGGINLSQPPTFNVTSLSAVASGTGIIISGTISAANASKSTVGIFIGSTALVSSATSTYIAFKDVSTAAASSTFTVTLNQQFLEGIGIPTGGTIYFAGYSINTNNSTCSGYTDINTGRRVYTAIGSVKVVASVVRP